MQKVRECSLEEHVQADKEQSKFPHRSHNEMPSAT